jgi:hypothetical protein
MSYFTFENDKKYIQIVSLGVRFKSPEERYRVGAQIVCDRCQSTPIHEGYGLGNQDLCLPCVDKVRNACGLPDISDRHTLMAQRQFRHPSEELTFMLQDQFVSRREPVSITNMRQRQYDIRKRTDGSDEEHITEPGEVCLFDDAIPFDPQQTKPQTRPESGPQWRTKMISEQYMQDCLTGSGRGRNNGDELARRLEEMQRLREQVIPVASNMDDLPGFSIGGGSSLDSQFGSLLTPEPPRATVPKSTHVAPTPVQQQPLEESRYGNGGALTRMSQGMFRTRMEMGMFRKK